MSVLLENTAIETFANLQHALGDIPLSRIRFSSYPATVEDVLAIYAKEKRLYELVNGVLVEKAMGFKASWLAGVIFKYLLDFIGPRNLGLLTTADGMLKLSTELVRIPGVSFLSWSRLPEGKVPDQPVPKLAPDLAVEVLSDSNTPAEMKRKRREYFKAGVVMIWIVDPEARTVTVYTSPRKSKTLTEAQTLDGGEVLPGFELSLQELFAYLDRKAPQ